MDARKRRLSVGMVTPHLPPEQAANALLPQLLCDGLRSGGDDVRLMALYPQGRLEKRDDVTYIPRMGSGLPRRMRLSHMRLVASLASTSRAFLSGLDVLHIHSNTFMNQVMTTIAKTRRIPFIVTHYGTEIWHYQPKRLDLFAWMNERAYAVTYYSRLLMERSVEVGIQPQIREVVYPPVSEQFFVPDETERARVRRELELGNRPLILNVKRLHPLAAQSVAIAAMPRVLESFPDAQFWIAGEGEERSRLTAQIRDLGLEGSVRLLGLMSHDRLARYYRAADLFALPSSLEAFPTVAVEALASGLRVVSADNPGGVELKELFPGEVDLVPVNHSGALAAALVAGLKQTTPVSSETVKRLKEDFAPAAVVSTYRRLYLQAAEAKTMKGVGAVGPRSE